MGLGTTTIGITVGIHYGDEISERSTQLGLSKSKYCAHILEEFIDSGKKLEINEKGGARVFKPKKTNHQEK